LICVLLTLYKITCTWIYLTNRLTFNSSKTTSLLSSQQLTKIYNSSFNTTHSAHTKKPHHSDQFSVQSKCYYSSYSRTLHYDYCNSLPKCFWHLLETQHLLEHRPRDPCIYYCYLFRVYAFISTWLAKEQGIICVNTKVAVVKLMYGQCSHNSVLTYFIIRSTCNSRDTLLAEADIPSTGSLCRPMA